VLCMVQAAWANLQNDQEIHSTPKAPTQPLYGLPDFDPLEGWIVSA